MEDPPAFTPGKVRALGEETKAASREILVRLVKAKFDSSLIGIKSWTSDLIHVSPCSLLHDDFKTPFAWLCKSKGAPLLQLKKQLVLGTTFQ